MAKVGDRHRCHSGPRDVDDVVKQIPRGSLVALNGIWGKESVVVGFEKLMIELNAFVYDLYGLTEEEIAIVEASVGR